MSQYWPFMISAPRLPLCDFALLAKAYVGSEKRDPSKLGASEASEVSRIANQTSICVSRKALIIQASSPNRERQPESGSIRLNRSWDVNHSFAPRLRRHSAMDNGIALR